MGIPSKQEFVDDLRIGSKWSVLSGASKVWVYAANRVLSEVEADEVARAMESFTASWEAHGRLLSASWTLKWRRVLVLAVDEMQSGVTGCSIDSSIAAIKAFAVTCDPPLDWFDRRQVFFRLDNLSPWRMLPLHHFWAERKAGNVKASTEVFNALVQSKEEWMEDAAQDFSTSWHEEMWK